MTSTAPPNEYLLCTTCYRKLAGQDVASHATEPLKGMCDRCGASDTAVIRWMKKATKRSTLC